MKVVITTGIYPPSIGGPSQYARNIFGILRDRKYNVKVLTYQLEEYLPIGIRHCWFLFRAIFVFLGTDLIIILDTLSVGWPSVIAAKILRRKTAIRIAGDRLWESYVERTGDLVLLKDFYTTCLSRLSFKEKLIYRITLFTLRNTDHLVFSTDWQRKIWTGPYNLDLEKTSIIENYFGEKMLSFPASRKIFLSPSRPLKLKNKNLLRKAFQGLKVVNSGAKLDESLSSHEILLERLQNCYAVIVPSISEVSPNFVLDALSYNKPVILTKECGLYEKLEDICLFIDPLSVDDLSEKIVFLTNMGNYEEYKGRISKFTFTHSWAEITDEFLNLK